MANEMSNVQHSIPELTWIKQVLENLYSLYAAKFAGASAAATLIFLFGDNVALQLSLVLFLFVDLITGVLKAMHNDVFSTAGLRKGAVKIATYLILVMLAHQFSHVSKLLLWFEEAIYCYLAITEYESIAENLSVFGIQWPSITRLYAFFQKLKNTQDR